MTEATTRPTKLFIGGAATPEVLERIKAVLHPVLHPENNSGLKSLDEPLPGHYALLKCEPGKDLDNALAVIGQEGLSFKAISFSVAENMYMVDAYTPEMTEMGRIQWDSNSLGEPIFTLSLLKHLESEGRVPQYIRNLDLVAKAPGVAFSHAPAPELVKVPATVKAPVP